MKPDQDDIPVIDLTEELEEAGVDQSSAEAREAVLAEALAHAATLEAQYRQPLPETRRTGVWKAPLALVLLVISASILAFPPSWAVGDPAPTLTEQQLDRGARAALFLQAQQVEAFRVKEGRLPGSLDELDVTLPGISFVRSNNRIFQLVTPGPAGGPVIYDSTRPAQEFEDLAGEWRPDR